MIFDTKNEAKLVVLFFVVLIIILSCAVYINFNIIDFGYLVVVVIITIRYILAGED